MEKMRSCCAQTEWCVWPPTRESELSLLLFFSLYQLFLAPMGKAALARSKSFTSQQALHPNHAFTATKQSAPLPAAHRTTANEQRTYANSLPDSHWGGGGKNPSIFLVRNNYCKTVENPCGAALCQWLKRLTVGLCLKRHTETRNLVEAITLWINTLNICLQLGLDKLFLGCQGLSLEITLWVLPVGGSAITLA